MSKDVVTSFRIDAELWKETKIYAIKNEISVKELLETLLRAELEEKRIMKEMKEE